MWPLRTLNRLRSLAAGVLGLVVLAVASAPADEVPRSREQIRLSFAPVVREAAPAVVNVYTRSAAAVASPW